MVGSTKNGVASACFNTSPDTSTGVRFRPQNVVTAAALLCSCAVNTPNRDMPTASTVPATKLGL